MEEKHPTGLLEDCVAKLTTGTVPKKFRVWDLLHSRWFQGNPSQKSRQLQTDAINFFGEVMVMEGTLFDQNEDDAWKKSAEAGEVSGSLDKLQYLCVVQDTGLVDCNGDHIFEGDILRLGNSATILGYVRYDKRQGRYVIDGKFITVQCDFEDCAIAGNCFEHYNLLKEDAE